MAIARELAGYPLGGADLLRRAMGKIDEKEELVRELAVRAGVTASAAAPVRCIQDKITRCIDNGWLIAPLNDAVRHVLELGTPAFQQRLLTDASRQDERNDVLCHPLVLNRWRDQLTQTLVAFAAAAGTTRTARACTI
ncbi:hypothetical protein [Streptomyces sp. NPDC002403]